MKTGVGELGLGLQVRGTEESLIAVLFADDNVTLAETEETLQKMVDEFDNV